MTSLSTGRTLDAERLRATMRRHASGITVVTVPGPAGFTAASFTSISLTPPLVSFCVGLDASVLPSVRTAESFGVHVLGTDQAELARRFARSGVDRFAGLTWRGDVDGLPIIDDVPAWLRGRVVTRQEVGDHLLVIGEVHAVGGDDTGRNPALVHHDGGFAGVTPLSRPPD